MSKSRQQFEELAVKEGLSLELFNGDYNWLNTRLAWEFWQASRECLEIELPGKHDEDYERDYFAISYDSAIEQCKTALTNVGVKIK